MSRAPTTICIALAAMAAVDLVGAHVLGLRFEHWSHLLLGTAAVGGIGFAYRWTGRSDRIASTALWVVLWVAFSVDGAILTYVAAAHAAVTPLYDGTLAALDHRLGFDWTAWFATVNGHPAFRFVLELAYFSLMPQILGTVFWFSYRGDNERNAELLTMVIAALVVTCALFTLFPSLGPGTAVPAFREIYLNDLLSLRSGLPASFDIESVKGIIAFPSFHTVLAVLFTYAHRGWRGFAPIATLNALVILATPTNGSHYLVDVLAGAAIAAISILAVRAAQSRGSAPVRATPR